LFSNECAVKRDRIARSERSTRGFFTAFFFPIKLISVKPLLGHRSIGHLSRRSTL